MKIKTFLWQQKKQSTRLKKVHRIEIFSNYTSDRDLISRIIEDKWSDRRNGKMRTSYGRGEKKTRKGWEESKGVKQDTSDLMGRKRKGKHPKKELDAK